MKLTKAQQSSLKLLYERQLLNDGGPQYKTYLQMRRAIVPEFGSNPAAMVQLWNMWLGIEPDGYTHS